MKIFFSYSSAWIIVQRHSPRCPCCICLSYWWHPLLQLYKEEEAGHVWICRVVAPYYSTHKSPCDALSMGLTWVDVRIMHRKGYIHMDSVSIEPCTHMSVYDIILVMRLILWYHPMCTHRPTVTALYFPVEMYRKDLMFDSMSQWYIHLYPDLL